MKKNLTLLYIINGLVSMHFFGGVLIPFFTEWGQLTFAQVMIIEAIFTGSVFVFEMPSGTLADRFGRKKVMIFGYSINLVAILVYTLQPSFLCFALGEILWGMGVAAMSGAEEAFLYETLKATGKEHESRKIFGRMGSIRTLCIALAAPVGSLIAKYISIRETMTFFTIPLTIAFILGFFLEEPNVKEIRVHQSVKTILQKSFQEFKQSPALKRILLDMIVMGFEGYYMIWIYQVRLTELNVDIMYFGLIQMGIVLVESVILSMFIPMEKIFGSKFGVVKAMTLIVGIGYLLTALVDVVWVVILGAMLGASFGFGRTILMSNYFNKHLKDNQRATMISSVSMLRQFTIMILNPLVGFGTESSLMWVLILIGCVPLIWVFCTPMKHEDLLN